MTAPSIITNNWKLKNIDLIIDVRSPLEFSIDHIPGSVNLPVLYNEEREIIGKIYKNISSFEARKKGAMLIAKNISKHLENTLCDKTNNFTPLIYCWRGGQRSKSMSKIFSEIGWRNYILNGGYKNYRKNIINNLKDISSKLNLIILSGYTGVGKTEIIDLLDTKGIQTINLEKFANHKGSLLGKVKNEKQPSQPFFESLIYDKLEKFDITQQIIMEAESSKIGNLQIPPSIWKKMIKASTINITAKQSYRANYLLKNYNHIINDKKDIFIFIASMKKRYGDLVILNWIEEIKKGQWKKFVKEILKTHFDPSYNKSFSKKNRSIILNIYQEKCFKNNFIESTNKIISFLNNNQNSIR